MGVVQTERPSFSEHRGTGSWHPAMRPDSNIVVNEDVAPDLNGEDRGATETSNAPQPSMIWSMPIINPEKNTDVGSGYEEPIEETLKSLAHKMNPPIESQTPVPGDALQELQGRRTETEIVDDTLAQPIDPPLQDVQQSQLPLKDQDQDMGSIPTESGFQEARHIDSAEAAQDAAHGHIQTKSQDLDEIADHERGIKAEMENAFRSTRAQSVVGNAAGLDQTDSFPEVPPLRKSTISPFHALAKSQAEDIIGDDEATDQRQVAFDEDVALQRPSEFNANNDEDEFFANIEGASAGPLLNPDTDEDARYEEGLPLVPSEHQEEIEKLLAESDEFSPKTTQSDLKGEDVGLVENSASGLEDSLLFRPQPLDRKTTSQVLDSLHYTPHTETRQITKDNLEEKPKDLLEEKPSLDAITGGGIAVSAQTVESEVFAEEHSQPEALRSKEDDLAEMWKAALGDDDLLDDDEKPLDPSVLFEDHEGFLDDFTSQGEDLSQAPFSPPLEAVYNTDGGIQGFGKPEQKSTPSGAGRYVPGGTAQAQQGITSLHQQNQDPGHSSPQMSRGVTSLEGSAPNPVAFGGAGVIAQQPYGGLAPPRPQMPASTQSYADKSKGGYTSPYDLPMDITRPKKRSLLQQNSLPNQAVSNSNARVPPPRSSSMYTSTPHGSQAEPAVPNISRPGQVPSMINHTSPTLKASQSTGSFFEELAPRPRPSTSTGKYTSPTQHQAPQAQPMAPGMGRPIPNDGYSQQAGAHDPQAYQLRQPEKMSLFGNTPLQQTPNQSAHAVSSRYSPAPHHTSSVPPPRTRYASSPIGAHQPPLQGLPFQPRTSSPLAQSALPRQAAYNPDPLQGRPGSDDHQPAAVSGLSAPQLAQTNHEGQYSTTPSRETLRELSPPLANSRYAPLSDSASSSSPAIATPSTDRLSSDGPTNYQSLHDPSSVQMLGNQARMAPQRSQTQSPGAARAIGEGPPKQVPYQRPASVSDKRVPVSTYTPSIVVPQQPARARGYSGAINYIKPVDGRELDPLERWRGCPIVAFGFGGTVVTSFPVQIPRYTAGQKIPMVMCSPGEVKIRGSKVFTLDDSVTTFPGPLKAKSKKKEVLEWLQNRIGSLEKTAAPISSSNVLPDTSKSLQEKILLWKTVKVIVEHDGIVDGNPAVEQAVREVLSPELADSNVVTLSAADGTTSTPGIVRRGGPNDVAPSISQDAMEELRKTLLHGNREKAVWLAVDNRMWAHAMLIANTLDPKISKQVSSEFIRQEVKSFGENTESLSALYQIFSGNGEESIDELVPPSARAGLQMVSKAASSGPTRNALDGLDRWRETLTLIMSNRTPEDGKALVSLGQLLAGYGRTEAAHICYIFAKSPALFGGPDDPQVSVALLGADHIRQSSDYSRDMDSILLTEVYDFALTTLASSSAATISPHLQSYKLYHAMVLAECGFKTEAQQYCDNITSALKSTTRLSPYYHPLLFGALENLTERLRQAPKDGSGSWISRPSIDKVSGSIWAKFNSYVAGDESDAALTGSGMLNESEAGPFARVAGDSPSISRPPSAGDLYGSHLSGLGLAPAATPVSQPVNSRYAPAGLYNPRSSQEQPSNAYQEPPEQESFRPTYAQQQYQSRPATSNGAPQEPYKPHLERQSYAPQQDNYLPAPPPQPEYAVETPSDQRSHETDPSQPLSPHTSAPYPEQGQLSFNDQPQKYDPPSGFQSSPFPYESPPTNVYGSSGYEPPSSSGYEPPSSSGYEPPSNSSYEPPSYEPSSYDPYNPQATSPTEASPRKRDIMNDEDEDSETRAAAIRKEERARKDREADELMRKAAEEDAKKDTNPKLNSKKSGWFGGWLGSGAKENKDLKQQQGNAPIKVKLGEESSFYFDKEKGKWVNKKANPEDEKASAPPPPPPKGPPSRAASYAGGPPPPHTTVTPPVPPLPTGMPLPPMNLARPPMPSNPASTYTSRSGTPALGEAAGETTSAPTSGPPSAPPSRPVTSQGGASGGGLDDLIGAPQARKGGTVRAKAKRKGYVDIMAK